MRLSDENRVGVEVVESVILPVYALEEEVDSNALMTSSWRCWSRAFNSSDADITYATPNRKRPTRKS
jgi:hypothetical protein